jgi:hypothetical protein
MWRIEGGEGQFAGVSGLITSNFFVGDDLAITDHHFGVLGCYSCREPPRLPWRMAHVTPNA